MWQLCLLSAVCWIWIHLGGVQAQPGRNCLTLCPSGNFTCIISCAQCGFDCCGSTCDAIKSGYVCNPACFPTTLNVSACCIPPAAGLASPPPPPPAVSAVAGPGNCSSVSLSSPNVAFTAGSLFTFNITGVTCNAANCSSCSNGAFTGSPSNFTVTILDNSTGVAPAGTSCNVSAGSPLGIFPVNCLAQTSYGDLASNYTLIISLLSYGSWVTLANLTLNIIPGSVSVAACIGTWLNGTSTFAAGSEATLLIIQKDAFNNTVSGINGRPVANDFNYTVIYSFAGNASIYNETFYINYDFDQGIQTVSFYPELVGTFYLQIGNQTQVIKRSPFRYDVVPGPVSVDVSLAEWPSGINTFQAGSTCLFLMYLTDDFGNIVNSTLPLDMYFEDKDVHNPFPLNITMQPSAYLAVSFIPVVSGDYLVHVGNSSSELSSSPLEFSVVSGPVAVANCTGSWIDSNAVFEAGDVASFSVLQMDGYNNNVSITTGSLDTFDFNASVTNVASGSIMPQSLLVLEPYELGSAYRQIDYLPQKSGIFQLYVGDTVNNITGSPFNFTVIPGALSIANCTASWIGGNQFVAGSNVSIQIQKMDHYNNSVLDNYAFVTTFLTASSSTPGDLPDFNVLLQNPPGSPYVVLNFVPTRFGNFSLVIGSGAESIANSPMMFYVKSRPVDVMSCIGTWDQSTSTFSAGTEAFMVVTLKDSYNNTVSQASGGYNASFSLSVSIMDTANITQSVSSYNVTSSKGKNGLQNIKFYPKIAGRYFLNVGRLNESLSLSPFPFTVTAGPIFAKNCTASWRGGSNVFQTGVRVSLDILLVDQYNNNVSLWTGRNDSLLFDVQVVGLTNMVLWNMSMEPYNYSGFRTVAFYPRSAGNFLLQVGSNKTNIFGSPYSFTVKSGSLSIPDSSGNFPSNSPYFTQNGTVQFYIYPMDKYKNAILVYDISPGNFTAAVYTTDLTLLRIPDLAVVPFSNTSLLMTFSMQTVGRFFLQVGNDTEDISGSPSIFYVTTDTVEPSRALLEGNGLLNSMAGTKTTFLIQFRDSSGNPAAANIADISVQLLQFNVSMPVGLNITAIPATTGIFQVSYIATVVGSYQVLATWKGMILGSGAPIIKIVLPSSIYGPWCKATGTGISGGVAGNIFSLQIVIVDSFNNSNPNGVSNVSVTFNPIASPIMTITNLGSGKYNVVYNITKASTYSMSVLVGETTPNQHVFGSPFTVNILAGPLSIPACVVWPKTFVNYASASQQASFLVNQRDKFGNSVFSMQNNVTAALFNGTLYNGYGTNGTIFPTPDMYFKIFTTTTSDWYELRFTVGIIGAYTLDVYSGATRLKGVPFSFTIVQEPPNVNYTVITGSGLSNAAINTPLIVHIALLDQFNQSVVGNFQGYNTNQLVVNVTRVVTSVSIFPSAVEDVNNRGNYTATYTLSNQGNYTVLVTWVHPSWKTIFLGLFNMTAF